VQAGIFHDFHHAWIEELKRALNTGLLPGDYYALAEQHASGLGPDVLTLEAVGDEHDGPPTQSRGNGGNLLLAPPKVALTAESELDFYRRKQSEVVVRHASGDRIVAVIEIISPGNKASRAAMHSFLEKIAQLLEQRIHLLVLDLHAPGPRDPQGIHGAIWEDLTGESYTASTDRPLTFVAYESGATIRAYVQGLAVGESLTDMPLFLEPSAHVPVPLEMTYERAFAALPHRWREVVAS
jgi:hypothetical protein